jgi:hypothetical protein
MRGVRVIPTRIDMSRSMMPAFSANTVAIPGIPSLSWLGSKSFGMEMTAGQVLALPIVLTRNSIPDTAICLRPRRGKWP